MDNCISEQKALELASYAIKNLHEYTSLMRKLLKDGALKKIEGYGDIGLECGFYSPTIADAFMDSFSRGKVYCKSTRKRLPDYLFYFDTDDCLVMWRGLFEIPPCFGVYQDVGSYRYGVRYQQISNDRFLPQLVTKALYKDGYLQENSSVWGTYNMAQKGKDMGLEVPKTLFVNYVTYTYTDNNVESYKQEYYVLDTQTMKTRNHHSEIVSVPADVSRQYIQFLRKDLRQARGVFEKGKMKPDNQKQQLAYLKSKYRKEMDLAEICQLFDKMLSNAEKTAPDSLVGFIYEITMTGFKLIRQTQGVGDEFYQLVVDISFDIQASKEIVDLGIFANRTEMMKYVNNSVAYKYFSAAKIKKVDISVIST